MLLGILGASLLGSMLTANKEEKGIVRAGYGSKIDFLIPPHPLTNFEIEEYYQNEPRFNGVSSRDNFPKKINYGVLYNKS